MATASNIHLIDTLIGRTVLARTTANKIGQFCDLIIDAAKGELAGLVVRMPDESLRCVESRQIYGFGPDAVVIESDESAVPAEDSPLKTLPLAKHNLRGVNVVTEGGKLLGQIANVYIRLAETLLLIYEARSSLLDKLLGHSLYFPATKSRAIAGDFARLIVSEETADGAANSLDALSERLFGLPKEEAPIVVVRSRSY